MVAGRADRVVADPVAAVPGVQPEGALEPALAAALLDRPLQLGDHRLEAVVGRRDGGAHLLDLVVVLAHPQVRDVVRQGVVGLLEGLLGGAVLDPGGVQARGQLEVGVAHEAHGDLTGILGRGGVELVDVPGGQPQLELDVGEGRAGADPELAVAGVGEELVAVAVGERAEVEHGLVPGCRAVVAHDRLEHEHGVRLAVGAEAGEPGERRVRAEHVVGVVAAHLEAAGRDDQPLLRVRGAEHGPALGGRGPRRGPGRRPRCAAGPSPRLTKARNSSVVARARLSACFCCSLTRPCCHEARGAPVL